VKNFPAIKFLYIDSTLEDYKTLPRKYLDIDEEFVNVGFDANELKAVFEKPEVYKVSGGEATLLEIITEWYRNYFKKNADIRDILGGCGGLPIVCRVSFLRNHFAKVAGKIENLLKTLNNPDELNLLLTKSFGDRYAVVKEEKGSVKINVYIILSLAGGTGRGLYEQVNVIVKTVARKLGLDFNQVRTRFFVVLPAQTKDVELPRYAGVNTYAGLKEVNVFQEKKYKTENYVKELYKSYGLGNIEEFVEKETLADHICLVSSKFGNGDIIAKDFNEFITRFAKFITDSIFDGFQNTLLARESNLENILSKAPKIYDVEGKKERGRHYSRLMYSSLYFPYEETINFISNYAMKIILEDIRLGSLPSRKRFLNKGSFKEDIKDVARKTLDALNPAKEYIRSKIESISTEISDIDMINQIIEDLDSIYESLKKLKGNLGQLSKLEDAIKEKIQSNFNSDIRLIDNVKKYISDYGGLQGFVNFLNDILEEFLENLLKYSKHLTTTQLVRTLENDSEYRKVVKNVIDNINSMQHSLQASAKDLEQIKASAEVGLKKLIKFIFKEIDEETREKARGVITSLKGKVNEFVDNLEKEIGILESFVVYRFLKTLIENFKKKEEVVKSLERELEAELDKTITSVKEGYKKLFLNSKEEGIAAYKFYNAFISAKGDKTLEEKYDELIEDKHIYNNIASFTFDFNSFRKELSNVINSFKEDISEKFKKDFEDGLSFLDSMLNPANEKFLKEGEKTFLDIQNTIRKWIRNEDFWGVIDASKAENSEAIYQKDTKTVILLIPKKYDYIVETIRNTFGDMTIEAREISDEEAERDTIKVMGMHYGLPLFVFSELRPMRDMYMKEKKDLRPKYHIAEWFIYEEEPIGESYGAGSEDLKYLLILAYVLGAIRGNLEDPQDTIERFSFITNLTLKCKYEPLEVGEVSRTRIRTDADIKDLSPHHRYLIVDQIRNSIIERYIYLVDKYKNNRKEKKILKNFLSPKSYELEERYGLIIPLKEGLKMLLKQKLDYYKEKNFILELVAII
ncbi:MAG TPA: hypothetical protein EYH58_07945, partial [Aquifex aeolicus]|nr:hypothetical protein [Aquifex aeolicus]